MLTNEFHSKGFCFISPSYYLSHENTASLHDLKKMFDMELMEDGYAFRKRAYLKLHWRRASNAMTVAANQAYYQTAASNTTDGGKVRQFKTMNEAVLTIPIVQAIVTKNINMIRDYPAFQRCEALTIGLHFIRYQVDENGASYSSPDWLHKDDEPLVFVHLINLSRAALGGDNLIADSTDRKITHVVRLEEDIDTLVLNKRVYHAVTPLGSKKGKAYRDVILFTVEPAYTQQ